MVGKDGPTISVNVRGIDKALWQWLKSIAVLEGKTVGKKLNEVLAEYRRNLEKS